MKIFFPLIQLVIINWFNSEIYFLNGESVKRQITDSISKNLTDSDLESTFSCTAAFGILFKIFILIINRSYIIGNDRHYHMAWRAFDTQKITYFIDLSFLFLSIVNTWNFVFKILEFVMKMKMYANELILVWKMKKFKFNIQPGVLSLKPKVIRLSSHIS